MQAKTFSEVLKFNPNHDSLGRFASAPGGAGFTPSGTVDSNGNELSEEQEEFFSDSVLRDDDDNLMVMYHGTAAGDFDEFDPEKLGQRADGTDYEGGEDEAIFGAVSSGGFFFADNAEDASGYGQNVREFYVNMKNPFYCHYDQFREIADEGGPDEVKRFIRGLKDGSEYGEEYDGMVITGDFGKMEYCAFSPNQIKATDNRNPSSGNNVNKADAKKGEKAFMDAYGWDKEQLNQATGGGYQREQLTNRAVKKSFSILKTDDDQRLVFGWASISIKPTGEQLEDRQHDMIDPEDLEEAAYEYVLHFRDTGEEHLPSMRKKGKLVESCVFTEEKQRAIGIPPGIIPVGWWIGFYIEDDDTWARIKNGTYRMFSVEGRANREPVEKADRPVGCGVLVIRDGKILTGTRLDRKSRGQTGGPGGHIEAGETPEEAAIRETREEFGITCRNLVPLGTTKGGWSSVFVCTEFDGEPHADGEEMGHAKWLTREDLRKRRLFPAFRDSLRLLDIAARKRIAKTFLEILHSRRT